MLVTATCVVGLVGCGGGDGGNDQQSAARDVAQQYVDAYNARDFGRACDLLADSYKQQLRIGSDCPGFLKEQTSGAATTLTLVGVDEKGNQAVAHVRARSTEGSGKEREESVGLIRQQDGSWRVAAVTGSSEAD
jgi:ketosteroid isomerase-like protein